MDTYNSFISQFEIFDNPPVKKGLHRHHIVPRSHQTEEDNRCIYVTPAQHLWSHILYDKENNTRTVDRLYSSSGLNKEDIKSYEDCLPFNDIITGFSGHHHNESWHQIMKKTHSGHRNYLRLDTASKISQTLKEKHYTPFKGHHHTEETNRINAEAHTGKNNANYGKHWCNNGEIEKYCDNCPEGFTLGRLRKSS